jgi:pimeloyl-ACP methyl ester carboxylesterase
MPTAIQSPAGPPIRGLQGLNQLNPSDAKQTLNQLATQIQGKSGVLKLMHTRKDRDMVFERKSGYQFWARRSGKMEQTAQALRALYQQAGLPPAAQRQLDTYLSKHGNRVGGSALANLIQTHMDGQLSPTVMARQLPQLSTSVSGMVRNALFGTAHERRTVAAADVKDRDLDAHTARKTFLNEQHDVDANYTIGEGAQKLQGMSRSAHPDRKAFDLSKPIVIFFGGSGAACEAYSYPAALAAGPDEDTGGLNFLAVDYRGFGQSADVAVTPRTVCDDGKAVYEHVLSLGFKPEQVILRGHSLGAAVAGQIHAEAELRGQALGGVVYDRPMSSAAGAAAAASGAVAGQIAKWSVGDFGAQSCLQRMPRNPQGQLLTPTRIIVDSSRMHGPGGRQMADQTAMGHKTNFIPTDHDDFVLANHYFSQFMANRQADTPQGAPPPLITEN